MFFNFNYIFLCLVILAKSQITLKARDQTISTPKKSVKGCRLEKEVSKRVLKREAELFSKFASLSSEENQKPTRMIGSKGHLRTIEYIVEELEKMSDYYTYYVQDFDVELYVIDFCNLIIDGNKISDIKPMKNSPLIKTGKFELKSLDDYGCEKNSFENFTSNDVVMLKRGVCSFATKSKNAKIYGVQAILVFDPKKEGVMSGQLDVENPDDLKSEFIPAFYLDSKHVSNIKEKLKDRKVEVELTLLSHTKVVSTKNIISQTKSGDPENVVMLGAHSDSVSEGPGMNDNASGAITLLSTARYLRKFMINNAVRFAWWSAEEEGLLGSEYYVLHLTPDELSKIRLLLNFDMLASVNYVYEIYDGNDDEHPKGSAKIKNDIIEFYDKNKLGYNLAPLNGRSDYVYFLKKSIPIGGVSTGAEELKKVEDLKKFKGVEDVEYDECYHSSCDDLSNLNYEPWLVNSMLVAHLVGKYADSLEDFDKKIEKPMEYNVKALSYRGSNVLL